MVKKKVKKFGKVGKKSRDLTIHFMPFSEIANEDATVTYIVTSYTIGGTNNANVVGTMNWTNSLTGDSGVAPAFAGQGFQVSDISLNVGNNLITVSGTNIYGQSTNSVVRIQRKTLIKSEPQIAINALIFPSKNCELYEGDTTNIIWDVELINDASNLLGEIPWYVPDYLNAGDTNYLMRFEVVDSSSLTNSRIFFDNKFIIVPEIGVVFSILCSVFGILWLRRHW